MRFTGQLCNSKIIIENKMYYNFLQLVHAISAIISNYVKWIYFFSHYFDYLRLNFERLILPFDTGTRTKILV